MKHRKVERNTVLNGEVLHVRFDRLAVVRISSAPTDTDYITVLLKDFGLGSVVRESVQYSDARQGALLGHQDHAPIGSR
jgi:hypothetical protein